MMIKWFKDFFEGFKDATSGKEISCHNCGFEGRADQKGWGQVVDNRRQLSEFEALSIHHSPDCVRYDENGLTVWLCPSCFGKTQAYNQTIDENMHLLNELVRLLELDAGDPSTRGGFGSETRIREVGEELNRKGGFELMQAAYLVVSRRVRFSQDIWADIGGWRP
jgi:hypothetical protein